VTKEVIAIDLERHRLYARGSAPKVYAWLCQRFDRFDMLLYSFPVITTSDGQLVATQGWTIDWLGVS